MYSDLYDLFISNSHNAGCSQWKNRSHKCGHLCNTPDKQTRCSIINIYTRLNLSKSAQHTENRLKHVFKTDAA